MNINHPIKWCDDTLNPTTGCVKISPGCENCYAERVSIFEQKKFERNKENSIETVKYMNGFKPMAFPTELKRRAKWKEGWIVFVGSMSDIFLDDFKDDLLIKIFEFMNEHQDIRFLVLTKRPERMLEISDKVTWSPNICASVSVEGNGYLDRVDTLKKVPAKVRMISVEPLLEEIPDLRLDKKIHWVIVGGESGPSKVLRKMKDDWVRSIKSQCQKSGTAFYFNQRNCDIPTETFPLLDGKVYNRKPSDDQWFYVKDQLISDGDEPINGDMVQEAEYEEDDTVELTESFYDDLLNDVFNGGSVYVNLDTMTIDLTGEPVSEEVLDKLEKQGRFSGCAMGLDSENLDEELYLDRDTLKEVPAKPLTEVEFCNNLKEPTDAGAEIAGRVIEKLLSYERMRAADSKNTRMTSESLQSIFDMANIITSGYPNQAGQLIGRPVLKPIAIPTPPGGGKTTLIVEALKYFRRHDPKFGAIVVVNRNDQIKRISEELGKFEKEYFKEGKWENIPVAYARLGWEKDYCPKKVPNYQFHICRDCDIDKKLCRVYYNKYIQKHSPILVMTHQHFLNMSRRKSSNYTKWGKKGFRRRLLLIDETPGLYGNTTLTSRQFRKFVVDVNRILSGNGDYDKIVNNGDREGKDCITHFEDVKKKVYRLFENEGEDVIMEPSDPDFDWSKDFRKEWFEKTKLSEIHYLHTIKNIIREGSIFYDESKLATEHLFEVHYSIPKIGSFWKTVIFDGTSNLDTSYRSNLFHIPEIDVGISYKHLTFQVCEHKWLSKAYIKNMKMNDKNKYQKLVQNLAYEVNNIHTNGQTLVMTYKGKDDDPGSEGAISFKEDIKKHLSSDIFLDHFGNTRGSNDYREAVNLVFLGILHKGSNPYKAQYVAQKSTPNNPDLSVTNKWSISDTFKNPELQDLFEKDILVNMIQDIYRTHLRYHWSKEDVTIYLIINDKPFMKKLQDRFPGCHIDWNWYPKAIVGKKQKFRELYDRCKADPNFPHRRKEPQKKAVVIQWLVENNGEKPENKLIKEILKAKKPAEVLRDAMADYEKNNTSKGGP